MTSRSATTGISRSVRDSYVAYRFAADLIRSNRRCRSSPTNGSACIQRLPARVCTSTVGLATRLWYQPGLLGAPACIEREVVEPGPAGCCPLRDRAAVSSAASPTADPWSSAAAQANRIGPVPVPWSAGRQSCGTEQRRSVGRTSCLPPAVAVPPAVHRVQLPEALGVIL